MLRSISCKTLFLVTFFEFYWLSVVFFMKNKKKNKNERLNCLLKTFIFFTSIAWIGAVKKNKFC